MKFKQIAITTDTDGGIKMFAISEDGDIYERVPAFDSFIWRKVEYPREATSGPGLA